MLSKQQIRALSEGEISFFPTEQGGTKAWWNTAARTKHVLAAYPPQCGWSITVAYTTADIPMYHAGMQVAAVWITVSLTDPQSRVVAQASALQPITDYKAFEAGETSARGRLYDALGFPGDIDAALGVATEGQLRAEEVTVVTKPTANTQPAAKAPTQPASNDVPAEPSLAEVAKHIGATGESIVVRDEDGNVDIIPKPPVSSRREVKPVAPREFAKRDKPVAAPSTAPQDPPPTEAGPGAESPEPASKALLEQVRSLAMMRGRKPAEIAERTKSKADAEAFLAELRQVNGAGSRQEEGAPA